MSFLTLIATGKKSLLCADICPASLLLLGELKPGCEGADVSLPRGLLITKDMLRRDDGLRLSQEC